MAPKKAEVKKPEEEGPRVYIKVDVSCSNAQLVSPFLVLGCKHPDQREQGLIVRGLYRQQKSPASSHTHFQAKQMPCSQIGWSQALLFLETLSAHSFAGQARALQFL